MERMDFEQYQITLGRCTESWVNPHIFVIYNAKVLQIAVFPDHGWEPG